MDLTLSNCFQNYKAYGLAFRSNLPLVPWLGVSNQPGDLVVDGRILAEALYIPNTAPLFTNPHLDHLGRTISLLYRLGDTMYLLLPSVGGFFIEPNRIRVQIQQGTDLVVVCAAVLSYAFTLWLEQHKVRCLHAATLCLHGKTAAFLADSTVGKSTLAAALLQVGAELLGDDIAPLMETEDGFMVSPAYPTMRLSKSQARQFLGAQAELAHWFPVLNKALIPIGVGGWEEYCNTLQKLERLYVLRRNPALLSKETRFEALSKTDAVLTMVRFSFGRRSSLALGTAAERMAFFTRLVEQVEVVRLAYPSGYEHLTEIARLIFQDMDKSESI